jgi:hypothetical protein
VEVELSKSQLGTKAVFEDYATADAALTAVYSKLRDNGMLTGTNSGLSNELGNYTDELIPFGPPTNPSLSFYQNALLSSTTDIATYWNAAYNQIYAVNSVIENIKYSTSISAEQKDQLAGEALFIRALIHFYLVNLFGNLPYIKETDYKNNSVVTRMPVEEVYQNIIGDLTICAKLLQNDYSSIQRVRANRSCASGLLARVYLYHGDFPEAANEASAVLNQTDLFELTENPQQTFLVDSKETIWQLQSAVEGQNAQEAEIFIFLSGPPPLVALNPDLVASFDSDDLRRIFWIKEVTNQSATWYHAYKYKQRYFTPVSEEYSVVLRLAEQYLIRAESRAQQGDLIGAKEDLNKIRNRAGLPNTQAVTKEGILQAILQERRWELFTEHGHRFFDLKRAGQLDNVLSVIKSGWNSPDAFFPIPQSELSANPNLRPQNPGY